MSFRPVLRSRAIAQAAAGFTGGAIVLSPMNVFAETPEESPKKLSIYDDDEPTQTIVLARSTKPSPTDRLAGYIKTTRLGLHSYAVAAEDSVNAAMTSALDLENSFTSTIASLAPAPESGEKLMPGSVYVLVAAMAGSIVARNRNILLRATLPIAVGVGAGWAVLPVTMTNVSDLLWKYETKVPAIADAHIRTREGVEKAWEMAKLHSMMTKVYVEDKITEGREVIEDWVKKGK